MLIYDKSSPHLKANRFEKSPGSYGPNGQSHLATKGAVNRQKGFLSVQTAPCCLNWSFLGPFPSSIRPLDGLGGMSVAERLPVNESKQGPNMRQNTIVQ